MLYNSILFDFNSCLVLFIARRSCFGLSQGTHLATAERKEHIVGDEDKCLERQLEKLTNNTIFPKCFPITQSFRSFLIMFQCE